ncbi:MAG: hypothetical protein ACKOQW_00565, partial [Phycisphaerales bacterium]
MSLFAPGERRIALLAQVAVERSLDRWPDGLTYAVPEALADLRAGERVRVPLGRGDGAVEGLVVRTMPAGADAGVPAAKLKFVECRSASAPPMPVQLVELAQWISAYYVCPVGMTLASMVPAAKLKFVESRAGTAPAMPAQLVELAQWISSYYVCPVGMTLASMTPGAVKRGVGTVTRTFVDLADGWEAALAAAKRVTRQQRAAAEALAAAGAGERPMELRDLCARAGLGTPEPVKKLAAAGILRTERRTAIEAEWRAERGAAGARPELTAEQRGVVDAIGAAMGGGFSQHLL